ncbi:hypothetical protein CN098_09215, partial [Sinorhizobium meliloti]
WPSGRPSAGPCPTARWSRRSHERRDQRAVGHGPADGRPEGHRNHKAQKHHGRPGPQQAGRRGSEQSGERNGGGNRPQRADGRGHQR